MPRIIICSFLLLSLTFFASCDKWLNGQVINYDLPEHTPVLTIYSNAMSQDSFLEVRVGATLPVLDENDEPDSIKNITIQLFKNNVFLQNISGEPYFKIDTLINWVDPVTGELTLLIDSNFTYKQPLLEPISDEAGTVYRLEVNADDYEMAYVEQVVPSMPDVSITLDKDVDVNAYDEYYDYESKGDIYTITFNNLQEKEQHYIIRADGTYANDWGGFYGQRVGLNTSNPIIEKDQAVLLLSDKSSISTGALQLEQWYPLGDSKKPVYIQFIFRAVSTSYVDYYRSINDYKRADGNPFAEPVVLYSNVENGLGVFSLMNQKIFKVIR